MTRIVASSLLCACVTLLGLATFAPGAHANGILVTQGARPDGLSGQAARTPIRLTEHTVQARITDSVAHVIVEHTFHSTATRPLEGTYLFPLPDGAVVSKFAMTMGGKMVQGEVIDAREARAIYNSIVRRRQDPGLLEYVGRGLFRARVFPIPPGGDVRIHLAFQQVLPQNDGVLEFRYPLATDRLNGAIVDRTRLDIQIASSVDLKGIYSPSHEVPVERTGERAAHIHIEQTGRRQRKDLLLYVSRSAEALGLSVLSNKRVAEDGTFMAVLAPRSSAQDATPLPKDVVFVLDTSGSMEGEKITQAKAALAHGVRTLRKGDRFNLISFASGVEPFRDGLIDATPEGKGAAQTWIEGRRSSGSTNIAAALTQALAMHGAGRLSLVVFITDGKPTVGVKGAAHLTKLVVTANKASARVFTFGVGYDLDVALLDRIAGETGGARDYVAPGEDIEIVTSRFFKKIREPIMTNVALEFGPGVYDVYPSRIPDLFAGSQVVVYGRYKEPGARLIRLRGDLAGTHVTHEYEAVFARAEEHDFLPRLWANRKVMFLLDEVRLHGESKEVVEEIIQLATRHAIVTPYTAGLVVEDGEARGRVHSANPLFQIGGPQLGRRRVGGRNQYRGPGGSIPPGLRGPVDPTPPPPPPPSGPSTTPPPATVPPAAATPTPASPTSPGAAARASQDLKKRKAASGEIDDASLRGVRARIANVAGTTFTLHRDGRWVDTTWDGKQATVKLTAFSPAYFTLLEKNPRLAKVMALGKHVVFVVGEIVYEVVPAKAAASR